MDELKNIKISDLTPEQIESRIKYLFSIPIVDAFKYFRYVLDVEYRSATSASFNTPENVLTELFIADKRFEKFMNIIYNHLWDYEPEVIKQKLIAEQKKLRKRKLNKLKA
jgi:hypothetical protein